MDTRELLVSLFQNTSTAMQSINDLIKKTDNKTFKDLLNAQYARYDKFQAQVENVASNMHIELKDNNWFEKAKLWSSVQMSTLGDNSLRHLAELMLLGTVMGTLTCYKNKYDYKNADSSALELLAKLEKMEEDNFDELKKYLKG